MSEKVLVSVIIPTYNRKTYVQEAIDSALEQTYPHKEIIVVDDGSTDGTCPQLKSKYGHRIKYIFQENRGEAAARNRGVVQSNGKYIAFLDSDDVWMPFKIEKQVDLIEARPEFGLVSCHVLLIDEAGAYIKTVPLHGDQKTTFITFESLVLNPPTYQSTVFIRRKCFEEVGGYDESIRYGEDFDLILRVSANYQSGFVLEPLVALRSHKDKQSRILLPKIELNRRSQERIRIIERAFSLYKDEASWVALLKTKAMAREYMHDSFTNFLYDDPSRGCLRLELGLSLDPNTWKDGCKVADMVYKYAVTISQEWSLTQAITFVEMVYSHLPAGMRFWRKKYRCQILGNLHITYAFIQYRQDQKQLVGGNVLKGILYDPKWLLNRGVWSIFIKS